MRRETSIWVVDNGDILAFQELRGYPRVRLTSSKLKRDSRHDGEVERSAVLIADVQSSAKVYKVVAEVGLWLESNDALQFALLKLREDRKFASTGGHPLARGSSLALT